MEEIVSFETGWESADRFFPRNSNGKIIDILCLLSLVSTAHEKEENAYPFLSSALQLSSINDASPQETSHVVVAEISAPNEDGTALQSTSILSHEDDRATEQDPAVTRSAAVDPEETPSTSVPTSNEVKIAQSLPRGDESDDANEPSETSVRAGKQQGYDEFAQ